MYAGYQKQQKEMEFTRLNLMQMVAIEVFPFLISRI